MNVNPEAFRYIRALMLAGIYAGTRDPSRNRAFAGQYMVAENILVSPTDDASSGGFCVVGDDLLSLVVEACQHFDLEPVDPKSDMPWIMHVPVLSTAHVTQETCNVWLPRAAELEFNDMLNTEEGWFLYLGTADNHPEWLDTAPADLRNVADWFHTAGFKNWIRLDGALGDVMTGLPTYDW